MNAENSINEIIAKIAFVIPSDSRSHHSKQARAKNSLFKLEEFSLMLGESGPIGGRSTVGSSCTNLYWYSGGSSENVCLFSNARRFVRKFVTKIESGVSRSMHPSRICSTCAAVDIFLLLRRWGFILKPGIDANTSRIVDAGVVIGVTAMLVLGLDCVVRAKDFRKLWLCLICGFGGGVVSILRLVVGMKTLSVPIICAFRVFSP